MTCIVGLVDRGKVWIGADSAASDGHKIYARNDCKLFKNGPFLFSSCGSIRPRQLLAHKFCPPKRHPDTPLDQYMTTDFIDALRVCMSEGGVRKKKDEVESVEQYFLVGHKGRLFEVERDFQVAEPSLPFHATGSGEEFALGALYATRSWQPRKRLIAALEAAEAYCTTVRGPFHIESI